MRLARGYSASVTDYAEEMRRTRIGEPPRHDGPIHLADYDPAWPIVFEREAARIRLALGERALRVEHVGSTAVPGLPAKPRIDILLVVPDSSDETAFVPGLERAGYVLHIRERDWHEHRVFKGPDVDVNLHVFSAECTEIERMLRFRDRLRENAEERALYLREKKVLAARTWEYVQQYADAKDEVVEAIIARAGAPPPNPDEHASATEPDPAAARAQPSRAG